MREVETFWEGDVQVREIAYNGANNERVPAYLVFPPGTGPYPAMIYLHAGAMDKDQYLEEALLLAEMGVVSLLIDGPLGLERVFALGTLRTSVVRDAYIRTVIDLRRGLDLLQTLPEVDAERIGFVGHSYGATWGGVLAGVETRIKAYVLMAGYAQVSENDTPEVPDLDAIHYVGHAAPAAILFQFSEFDPFIDAEEAQLYYDTASEPKTMLWYKTDHHGLKTRGRVDRLQWLSEQLGFVYQPE